MLSGHSTGRIRGLLILRDTVAKLGQIFTSLGTNDLEQTLTGGESRVYGTDLSSLIAQRVAPIARGDRELRDLFLVAYSERLDLGFEEPDPLVHSARRVGRRRAPSQRIGRNGSGSACSFCGAVTYGLSDLCGRCGR